MLAHAVLAVGASAALAAGAPSREIIKFVRSPPSLAASTRAPAPGGPLTRCSPPALQDFAWRHSLSGQSGGPVAPPCADASQFKNTTDLRCNGLKADHRGDSSESACLDACCADLGCSVYQWKDPSNGQHGSGCWVGSCSGEMTTGAGWLGGYRNDAPTPGPPASVKTGPLSEGFDDSAWDVVDVPHDFIIGGEYNQTTPGSGTSYLPRYDSCECAPSFLAQKSPDSALSSQTIASISISRRT